MGRAIHTVDGTKYLRHLPFHGGQNSMPADCCPHFRGSSRSNRATPSNAFSLQLHLHYQASDSGSIRQFLVN